MTLSRSQPRAKSRWALLAILVGLGLLVGSITTALAGPSADSGFEGSDANLVNNGAFDWNDFAPTTWSGTAPYRTSNKVTSGWEFRGLEDAQNDGTDSVFGGGVKQDNECAAVSSGPKPPNKSDLERIYLANKKVGDHHYLALSWVRTAQNSTTASAHTAFEFNQNQTRCSATSPLVTRSTANGGDMLIVYDFEGGSAPPLIKLSRWQTTGTCEQTGKPAATTGPCWVVANANLSASGFAEAAVNVGGTADDAIAPTPETLGPVEFGEAIINLSTAGVFPTGDAQTCLTFGRVFGVSRSSGNSGVAQMKDLVGPGAIEITNCGSILIEKEDQDGNALAGAEFALDEDGDPDTTDDQTSIPLVDGETALFCIANLLFGEYTVVETTVPPGYSGEGPKPFVVNSVSTCAGRTSNGGTPDLTFVNVADEPDLTIVKEADRESYSAVGDVITYTITVTNTGNVTLTNVEVTDELLEGLEDWSCDPEAPATLAPEDEMACTATYTVTQEDLDAGQVFNEACVNSDQTDELCDDVTVPAAILEIIKEADSNTFSAVDDQIVYTITATNTGQASLTNVDVTDSLLDELDDWECDPQVPTDLDPGESIICTATYTITEADFAAGKVLNTACADSDETEEVCNDVTVRLASISIVKTVDKDSAVVGSEFMYTFVVTNTGQVTLTNVTVVDLIGEDPGCDPEVSEDAGWPDPAAEGTLEPEESVTFHCTATYIEAVEVTNIATATGEDPDENEVSDDDTVTVTVDKAEPSFTTEQRLLPNDSASLVNGYSPTGTLTFSLFSPTDPGCEGTPAYTEDVPVTGNGDYSTTNGSQEDPNDVFYASTEGTWNWFVEYDGDTNNEEFKLECGHEHFTIQNSPDVSAESHLELQ